MEDKDGNQQPKTTKDAAHATARSFWIKLFRVTGTYTAVGDLNADQRDEYLALMEGKYPWLRLCQDHWKAVKIWHNHYPQWWKGLMKKLANEKMKKADAEVAALVAAEGRVIDVDDNDNGSQDGKQKHSKQPRSDNETSEPKCRCVEKVEPTPPSQPTPAMATTRQFKVCFFTPLHYLIYLQHAANPTVCQGGPQQSPEIQSTLVWSLCWGATGSARRSTQRGEQRRIVRARGNKGEVRVTRDQCRVW